MMITPCFLSPLPRSRKPVAPVNLPAPEKRNVCATSFIDPPATAQSLETPRDLGSCDARSAASAGNRLREKLLLGGKVQPAGTERTGRNSSQSNELIKPSRGGARLARPKSERGADLASFCPTERRCRDES